MPRGLSETAEELGLSYRQTMMLLDIEHSIVARRGGRPRVPKNKEEWRSLYDAVSAFLEDPQ